MIFIVISTPTGDTGEPEIVNRLFENGLHRFHLRKPDWSEGKLRWYIERIAPQYHSYLTLHSHHDLAGEYNLGGLHFPEWALEATGDNEEFLPMDTWKSSRPDLRLSTSFHSLTDLELEEPPADYVFYSPVFPSVSKPGHRPQAEESDMMLALRRTRNCAVGLGGITLASMQHVGELGFAGCAVLGAVWKKGDPVQNCRELLAESYRLKESVSSVS